MITSLDMSRDRNAFRLRFILGTAIAAFSFPAFIFLYGLLGSSFLFFVIVDVIIAAEGMFIPFLFGAWKLSYLKFVYLIVIFALAEEILVNTPGTISEIGVGLAFCGLVGFPALGAIVGDRSNSLRIVLEASGLIFAMRLILAVLPASVAQLGISLPLSYTVLMLVLVSYVTVRSIPLSGTGLFAKGIMPVPIQVLIGLGIGLGLGLVQYLFLRNTISNIGSISIFGEFYIAVTEVVFIAITEEFLFRGLLLNYLNKIMPKWMGINISSLIFAIFHIGYLSPIEVIFAYLIGMAFAYLAVRTGSLTSPILAHGIGSVVMIVLAQTAFHI